VFLAGELSTLTRYYDRLIQWLPREDDSGILLATMDAPVKESVGETILSPISPAKTKNALRFSSTARSTTILISRGCSYN
jgi:hypothetical protein